MGFMSLLYINWAKLSISFIHKFSKVLWHLCVEIIINFWLFVNYYFISMLESISVSWANLSLLSVDATLTTGIMYYFVRVYDWWCAYMCVVDDGQVSFLS